VTNVKINSVAKSYGQVSVLSDITTQFPEGSFTSLLGPSGSGKTTLLRIVAGFVTPDSGTVSIGSRDVTNVPVWARNIGMVFQSYALFPHMTVRENVAFGLARRGIRGAEARSQIDRALEMVRLPGFGDRKPKQLSGGQQQRVALARALVIQPSVLLLDEPLSALDRRLRQEMQVELKRIQRETGLTTVFVTHDQEEALALSDQVAILDRGQIVQMGVPMDIYEKPTTRFAAEFLGDTNFLTGTVSARIVTLSDGTAIRLADVEVAPTDGQSVTLAVRPEKIRIVEGVTDAESGLNRLLARVTAVIYAGAALTYVLTASDGTPIKIFAQNTTGMIIPEGAQVTLTWEPKHTILLQDQA
jgi:putative spermidine/putrescine transport system ATP-binding protein/spermidine/putrescine transport system ATP-binding protein